MQSLKIIDDGRLTTGQPLLDHGKSDDSSVEKSGEWEAGEGF